MYKSQSRAEQFLTRTGSYSTVGSRAGAAPDGYAQPEPMTPQQAREVMVARKAYLTEQIIPINAKLKSHLPYDLAMQLKAQREEIGAEMRVLDDQLSAMRAELSRYKNGDNFGDFIVEVVRENMTKPQWDLVVKEARRRFEAQEK